MAPWHGGAIAPAAPGTTRTERPRRLQSLPGLVGPDEAGAVGFWNLHAQTEPELLDYHQAFSELLAAIVVRALRAVIESARDDAGSHGAGGIHEAWVLAHATIAADGFGWNAEAEIRVPAVAELLAVGGFGFDVGPIRQAEIAAIAAAGEDGFHGFVLSVYCGEDTPEMGNGQVGEILLLLCYSPVLYKRKNLIDI